MIFLASGTAGLKHRMQGKDVARKMRVFTIGSVASHGYSRGGKKIPLPYSVYAVYEAERRFSVSSGDFLVTL